MFNFICDDVEKQKNFYSSIIGWKEVIEASSPICRVLKQGDTQLTFNGRRAYDLMNIKGRERGNSNDFPIAAFGTFTVDDYRTVDEVVSKIISLGGAMIKYPFATYYGHWQIIFQDPEGNVARITATSLPDGQEVPVLETDSPI